MMERIHGSIKIELMSDLCAGSGYSYAGVIDSDVAYDEFGLPQIPARRLKGCMREAAELVCPEAAEALFGNSGDNGVKGIILGNAYIEDRDEIVKELEMLTDTKQREAFYLSPQNILEMYTSIRAQTKISQDTGVAEENTLRFTRVVGQYAPGRGHIPLCFFADVEFDRTYQEQMERIVAAVRNLGMNRSRGLGSVRCTFKYEEQDGQETTPDKEIQKRPEPEGRVCLTYVLYNREPLLMSSDNTAVSDSYISGKSILGSLAGAYLRRKGNCGDSEEFRNLFLNGRTIFTDANLTFPPKGKEKGKETEDAAIWPDYYPAPLYLNRLKKTKVLVNVLADRNRIPGENQAAYDTSGGNLPKKLKTHYVHEAEPNVCSVAEPERDIYYHNSERKLLYSQEAVKEGQHFRGKIYTDRKYADLLRELLEESRLSFGKSRTAQYGTCIVAAKTAAEAVKGTDLKAESGERIAVVLCSDAVFFNNVSGYTVRFDEVKALVGEQLGIPYDRTRDDGSIIQTKEITGYNTIWNLRRAGMPAVKAGSVLVYTIARGERWQRTLAEDQAFVGERNQEGYGHIRILHCDTMKYEVCQPEEAKEPCDRLALNRCRPFLVQILTKQLLERLIFLYTRQEPKLGLTAATVGRLDLMLIESLNEHRADPEQAFQDFCTRINSIKRKKAREKAFSLLEHLLLRKSDEEGVYELDLQKMTGGKNDPALKEIEELLYRNSTEEEYRKVVAGVWGAYMENILTYHKYRNKHEGGAETDEE